MSVKALNQVKPQPISSASVTRSGILQRKCACGGTPGPTGECEECRKKREAGTPRRAPSQPSTFNTQHSEIPPIVHEVLSSPGRPLDSETRAFIEPRFGYNFSQVRVHTDARAVNSARSVNASAYTVGSNIVFAADQYEPGATTGMKLLAHELTHVLQQRGHVSGADLKFGPSGDTFERKADSTASAVINDLRPRPIRPSHGGAVLQRQENESGGPTDPSNVTTKTKRGCPLHESNRRAFAIRIALHHRSRLVKEPAGLLPDIGCSSEDVCRVRYSDGVIVDVLMVEIPKQVSAGATIGGKEGQLCDYSYSCPEGEPGPVVFTELKCY